ncbi:hypothetical protein JCM11641_005011 [Rhodosporidiobolus odoratus]
MATDVAQLVQDIAGEGVPRYEGSPSGSSSTPRFADEKRLGPFEQERTLEPVELLRDKTDEGRANVERWRSGHVAPSSAGTRSRRNSDAQSAVSFQPDMSMMGGMSGGDSSALEGMSDAEIAQHHFRLAQQHLEAAQRLAMAAAAQPSRPHASAPNGGPPSQAGRRPSPPQRDQQVEAASSYFDESDSVIDPSEPAHSPTSPGTSLYDDANSEFGKLSIRDAVDASYDWRLSRSLSSLHPSSWSESSPSPGVLSTSATSIRSAPTRSSSISKKAVLTRESPAHPPLSTRRAQPQPPPARRATLGAGMTMTPVESASRLQPSLYGGGLPPGVLDRMNQSGASAPAPSHIGVSPVQEEDSLVGSGDEAGPLRDFDDAASDFHDAQSSFSHVTYATLPPYEASSYSPPPVPALPPQFAHSAAPPADSPGHHPAQSAAAYTPRRPSLPLQGVPAESGEDFHGFRPRVPSAPAVGAPASRVVVNAPSPYASAQPTYGSPAYRPGQPQGQPQPQHQAYAAPTNASVPLHYILGPNGQPIPVYAAPSPFSSGPALSAPVSRAPLPIHSQPLEFNHTVPYYATRQPLQQTQAVSSSSTAGPAYPSGILQHSGSNPNLLSLSGTYQHSAPSSASLTPSNSSGAPTTSHHPSLVRRPSSASSNASTRSGGTAFSTATHTTVLRRGMASLRSKVKSSTQASQKPSPHVRFQSPDPTQAKARAMESVFEDDDEDVANLSPEARARKQRDAMKMSLGMLM